VLAGFDGRRHGLVVLFLGHADTSSGFEIRNLARLAIASHLGVIRHRVAMLVAFVARRRELVAGYADDFAFVCIRGGGVHSCVLFGVIE